MSILDRLSLYFSRFPGLSKERFFDSAFLPGRTREFSLACDASPETLGEYLDGSRRVQYLFHFGTLEPASPEVLRPLLDEKFSSSLKNWLFDQERKRLLPDLGDHKQALKLEVLSPGSLQAGAREGQVTYQIPCRLIYIEKGENNLC